MRITKIELTGHVEEGSYLPSAVVQLNRPIGCDSARMTIFRLSTSTPEENVFSTESINAASVAANESTAVEIARSMYDALEGAAHKHHTSIEQYMRILLLICTDADVDREERRRATDRWAKATRAQERKEMPST